MKKYLVITVISLLLCSFITIGCQTSATPSPTTPTSSVAVTQQAAKTSTELTPQYGGVLKRLSAFLPGTPIGYPPESYAASLGDTCPAIEGLILLDVHNKITYKLATNVEVASDKMSLNITLRKGVKFHDGTDFNAAAAKWAMDNWINAKRAPLWKSVDVIDDYILRLNLVRWDNSAVQSLNYRLYISPTAFQKNGLDWVRWNPVGTGPFKFVSFTRDNSLIFTKFDGYWNNGLPYLDGIEFHYFADVMTMTASLRAGEGHTMRMGTQKTVAELQSQGFEVITTLTVGVTKAPLALFPDSKNADSPYSRLKVREAIDYALDKEGICKAMGYGFWIPSYQFPVKNTDYWVSNLPDRTYNVAKARQLLTEAGFPNGFQTRLIPQPGMVPTDVAAAIQNQLKAVGIQAEIETPQSAKFSDYQQKGWTNALLITNAAGGSPNFASGLRTGISNYSTTCASLLIPAAYQKALDEATTTLEIEKAKTQELVKMLYEDETVIPLYYNFEGDPMVKGIHNIGSETVPGDPIAWTPNICWMEKSAWSK